MLPLPLWPCCLSRSPNPVWNYRDCILIQSIFQPPWLDKLISQTHKSHDSTCDSKVNSTQVSTTMVQHRNRKRAPMDHRLKQSGGLSRRFLDAGGLSASRRRHGRLNFVEGHWTVVEQLFSMVLAVVKLFRWWFGCFALHSWYSQGKTVMSPAYMYSYMHTRMHTHTQTHTHTHTHKTKSPECLQRPTNTHISSHIHTHTCSLVRTHYKYMHYWWWVSRMRRRKMTNQYAERWVFSFDLKDEREEKCLTERGREFQITGPMYLKDLSPKALLQSLDYRNSEDGSHKLQK